MGGQALLGLAYEFGQGVPQDYTQASRWYRLAAEQGSDDAQLSLGELFLNGHGVTRDYAEAVRWISKAAIQGNDDAQFALGEMYLNGRGVPIDHAEAFQWFLKAANQGNADAQYELSRLYACRRDIPPEHAEATVWLQRAAEQGHAEAQLGLALDCATGLFHKEGGATQDDAAALMWLRKAADQGLAQAQEFLGSWYERGTVIPQDMGQAVTWYRRAAAQGRTSAQERLGVLHAARVPQLKDDPKAAEWFRKLADPEGDSSVQFDLGLMYYMGGLPGVSVPEDFQAAATWFRRAADQEHGSACLWLGLMYENGHGVPRDSAAAEEWYRKEAEIEAAARECLETLRSSHGAAVGSHPQQEAADPRCEVTQVELNTKRPVRVKRGLDNVAGMHGLKALLRREVVDYVRNPERHKRYGLSLPNGILLYGPPGCGKTYIARLLAEELGHHFVEITPGDVASPYIHDTVKQIRTAFDAAAAQAPAVMFIDEFEAFVPPRGELGGTQHYKAEEVNEFLALLSGCSEKGILVIAATNLPGNIDPAVRRTGRLDKHIYVGPPDAEARADMLALHLGTRPVSTDLDLTSLAEKLGGYSASDIKFLVDQAARHAMEAEADIAPDSFRFAMAGITPSVPPEVADQYRSIEQRGN